MTFLWYLEELVGGPALFEPFLKAYYKEYAFKSIDSDTFKNYFGQFFANSKEITDIDWDLWLYQPGMPSYKPKFDSRLAEDSWKLAECWKKWSPDSDFLFDGHELDKFAPNQVQEFLGSLLKGGGLQCDKLENMDVLYRFSGSTNCEILFLWLRLGLKSR